jgi:hypothetical protein
MFRTDPFLFRTDPFPDPFLTPFFLSGEVVFPELLQHQARPEHLAREALALLTNPDRRQAIQAKLARVVASLGGPGASDRAAAAIPDRVEHRRPPGIQVGFHGEVP